jgi:hypothetical protein
VKVTDSAQLAPAARLAEQEFDFSSKSPLLLPES